MTTKAQPKDAIAMLEADHRKVEALFEEFDGLSDRSKASKKKIADQICMELSIHAEVEEQVFYPADRGPVKDDDLMDEAVVEHASAKELIPQILEMDPGDNLYDAKVKVLSEQIDHHVKEEEEEMFPKVRKGKLDMVVLGEEMEEFKARLNSFMLIALIPIEARGWSETAALLEFETNPARRHVSQYVASSVERPFAAMCVLQ